MSSHTQIDHRLKPQLKRLKEILPRIYSDLLKETPYEPSEIEKYRAFLLTHASTNKPRLLLLDKLLLIEKRTISEMMSLDDLLGDIGVCEIALKEWKATDPKLTNELQDIRTQVTKDNAQRVNKRWIALLLFLCLFVVVGIYLYPRPYLLPHTFTAQELRQTKPLLLNNGGSIITIKIDSTSDHNDSIHYTFLRPKSGYKRTGSTTLSDHRYMSIGDSTYELYKDWEWNSKDIQMRLVKNN